MEGFSPSGDNLQSRWRYRLQCLSYRRLRPFLEAPRRWCLGLESSHADLRIQVPRLLHALRRASPQQQAGRTGLSRVRRRRCRATYLDVCRKGRRRRRGRRELHGIISAHVRVLRRAWALRYQLSTGWEIQVFPVDELGGVTSCRALEGIARSLQRNETPALPVGV